MIPFRPFTLPYTMGKFRGQAKLSKQDVAYRVGAALFGGYGLTYAVTACMMLLLPLPRNEAILAATMLSFVIYICAILWAFSAATPAKAWLGLLIPAMMCAAVALPLARAGGG